MIININILIGPCLSLKEMQSQVTADSEIYNSQICDRQIHVLQGSAQCTQQTSKLRLL